MWVETISSVEGLISAVAMLITAIGGALFAIKNIANSKPDNDVLQIPQGQAIQEEQVWLQELHADADRADQLLTLLTLAVIRLSEAGLPYKDLLPPEMKTNDNGGTEDV